MHRGKQVRSTLILRIFAVERFLRVLIFGAAAFAVWRFESAQETIEQAFNRELPVVRAAFRELGYNVDHSKLAGLIQHALTLSPGTISLIAGGLAAYAAIELVEGTGLWLGTRWGEYFAMVVTSLGLPYEIYDMTTKVTVTRAVLFAINLALVLYLVITKRLFGVRGGKTAYVARLRSESVMEAAINAAAARRGAGEGRDPQDRDPQDRNSRDGGLREGGRPDGAEVDRASLAAGVDHAAPAPAEPTSGPAAS